MVRDCDRISDKAVDRDKGRQRWKQREQQIEGGAGRDQQNPVLVELFP